MNQRFAAIMALLAVALLLLLVRALVSRVWSEGFCGQRGHGGHSGVRYGIAHHDRGGRIRYGGYRGHGIRYGGGEVSWWPYWPYGSWPEWRAYWPWTV